MTDYDKFKTIIDEIDNLISHHVRSSAPAFEAWYTKTERFLIKKYGKRSLEHDRFINTSFMPMVFSFDDEESDRRESVQRCAEGLRSCKAVFRVYLEEMEEEKTSVSRSVSEEHPLCLDRVFIVHGHDGELKQAVARVIEKQDIEAIILSEQANRGRTIIEKFEDYADVGGAICLFTADDLGRARRDQEDNPRARQNVVLEAGYFMGKLGRDHVVFLADNGIEMPSDLSGVVYTNASNWQIDLLKELKAMGYTVDFNKLF